MARKIYDIAVKTGTYTDGQGQEKGRWKNVGVVMKGDDGNAFMMIERTFNPAGVPDLSGRGGDTVLLSLFEPRQQGQQGQSQQPQQSGGYGGQTPAQPHHNPAPGNFDDESVPF